MIRNRRFLLLIFCIVALTLGCRYTSPTPVAWRGTETSVAQTRTESARISTSVPTPTRTPEPTVLPTRASTSIPSNGPWLIFPNEDGTALFAADRNSHLVRKLDLPSPLIAADLPAAVSPDGNTLLVRGGNTQTESEFALFKVSGTNLAVQKLTSLVSSGVQKDTLNVNNRQAIYAMQAVMAPHGISWNPKDGGAAFLMAVDGDSTNLFRFNPATQKIDRRHLPLSARPRAAVVSGWTNSGFSGSRHTQ